MWTLEVSVIQRVDTESGDMMPVGLKYAATIVAHPPKELKRRVQAEVRKRKQRNPYYSMSQFVTEAMKEKLERETEAATEPVTL